MSPLHAHSGVFETTPQVTSKGISLFVALEKIAKRIGTLAVNNGVHKFKVFKV